VPPDRQASQISEEYRMQEPLAVHFHDFCEHCFGFKLVRHLCLALSFSAIPNSFSDGEFEVDYLLIVGFDDLRGFNEAVDYLVADKLLLVEDDWL
jgi:hypothetical protein